MQRLKTFATHEFCIITAMRRM